MKKNELRRSISRKGVAQKAVFLIVFGLVLCAFAVPSYAAYFSFNAGCDNNLDGFGGGVVRNQSGVVLPVGSVLQYIYAGPDATIQPPNAVSGAVTGDDVLLGTTTVGDDNSWFGFSGTAGCFYNGYGATYTTAGPKIYVRAWNSSAIGSATYYGNSALFDPATDANNPPQPNDTGLATFSTGTTFVTPADITVCTPARYQGDTSTFVSVTGTNTHFTQGITTAEVSGAGVTVGTVEVTSTTEAKVYITSILTSATAGGRDITLRTTAEAAIGEAGTAAGFVISAPSLNNVAPSSGTQGTVVSAATVNGTGTHFNGASTSITFSGAGVTGEVTGGTATAATVNIYIAAGAAATARNVTMTTNLGVVPGTETVIGSSLFTVTAAAPSITSHNPTSGVSGTQVTIAGSNFGAARGGSTVTFNGTAVAVATYIWSDTVITVEAPVGGTTGNIVVTVGGQSSSGTHTFTYNTPSISSVTPNQANIGDSVVIAGSNFGTVPGGSRSTTANRVTLGATQLTDAQVTAWTNTSITVTIPTGLTAGSYNFVVRAGGNNSGNSAFTVTPEVTGVSGSPYYIGNATITISGSGFGAAQGSSTVTVGGQSLTGITWGATQITGVLPNSIAAGPQNVVVTVVNSGSFATNAYSINCVPYISGLVPSSGSVGDSVTINGYGFGGSRGTSEVTFNGTAVTSYAIWGNTSVQVVVPAGASTGNVVLTVNPGSYASNGQTFTVSAPSSGSGFIYEKAGGIMMAYPNPFNPDDKANPLKMLFNAATGEAVDIYIFDTNGRIIYQNRNSDPLAADRTITWDGETSYGEVVDNGLYLIRIIKDGKLVAKAKILVIKK